MSACARRASAAALRSVALWILLGLPAASPPAVSALERVARRAPDTGDAWMRSAECTTAYYNLCTGWIWVWSHWAPGDRAGVVFANCGYELVSTRFYVLLAPDAGYGHTGTISVRGLEDGSCPGPLLSAQPFLPQEGWNVHDWSMYPVTVPFVLEIGLGSAPESPVGLVTDHPALGPNGVFGCGNCYPASRPTRSFRWGPELQPLCPGEPLFDGTCNAEIVAEAAMAGEPPNPVRATTWGQVKALYR